MKLLKEASMIHKFLYLCEIVYVIKYVKKHVR